MTQLSETHLSYLKMFGPDTYGVQLPYSIAKTLEIKGLVEWIPPQFGTAMWTITKKGREALKSAQRDAWDAAKGYAPDATGDLSSEEFVRKMRDEEWR